MTSKYAPRRLADIIREAFPGAKVTGQEDRIFEVELPELTAAEQAKLEALLGCKVAKVTKVGVVS